MIKKIAEMYSSVTLSNEEGESAKAEKEDEKSEDIFEFLVEEEEEDKVVLSEADKSRADGDIQSPLANPDELGSMKTLSPDRFPN
jgi:hypothetical protein